uniref:Gamma-glutamyltransferase 5a n=1 Tax=Haplochromis burtoni TaxID=8153 RepID=A0A3Q2V6C4_HAPBU
MKCIVFIFAQQNNLFHCFCSGGTLTLEDLASYQANVTDAWNISLGEYRMYFPPPPLGGAILSFILNIMKGNALLFSNSQYFTQMAKNLTEDSFADNIRSLISSDKTHDRQYYGDTPCLDSIGTTHVSVLAEDGSAVSVTSTINDEFGSKVLSPSTGIILNNQLFDFCNRANRTSHGRRSEGGLWERPPSNMAPSVLKSPSKTLVIGGSGAEMIPPAVASVCMHGIRTQVFCSIQVFLLFALQDVVDGLEAKGHKITQFYNTVNAVEKAGSCISAWSDKRKKGEPAGY